MTRRYPLLLLCIAFCLPVGCSSKPPAVVPAPTALGTSAAPSTTPNSPAAPGAATTSGVVDVAKTEPVLNVRLDEFMPGARQNAVETNKKYLGKVIQLKGNV